MIVPVHADGKSGESQSERIVLAMYDGSLSMADRGRPAFFVQSGAQEQAVMAHRGKRMRQRISGIECECPFKKHQRLCYLRGHPGINVRLCLQDQVIGVEALRPLAFDALDFGPAKGRLVRADHVEGDLVLKRENVVQRTVETLRPQIACGLRLYHMRGDADPVAVLAQASLQ